VRVELDGLRKSYGKVEALKGLDLTIEDGMFGLLGPNGAGKTTLMRIITTLLDPSSSRGWVLCRCPPRPGCRRRDR
jgi:ABC-2 type transport system ATP-binding protein